MAWIDFIWVVLLFTFMVIGFVLAFTAYMRWGGLWSEWWIKKYYKNIPKDKDKK